MSYSLLQVYLLSFSILLSIFCQSNVCAMSATPKPKPALEIPAPLLSLTPGTWAYDTMSRRVNGELL